MDGLQKKVHVWTLVCRDVPGTVQYVHVPVMDFGYTGTRDI